MTILEPRKMMLDVPIDSSSLTGMNDLTVSASQRLRRIAARSDFKLCLCPWLHECHLESLTAVLLAVVRNLHIHQPSCLAFQRYLQKGVVTKSRHDLLVLAFI